MICSYTNTSACHLKSNIDLIQQAVLENTPEITYHLDDLNSASDALSKICRTPELSEKADEVTEHTQDAKTLARGRHDVLMEKAKEWDEYQKDVDNLGEAIEETKASLFDPNLEDRALKDQYTVQDVSVSIVKRTFFVGSLIIILLNTSKEVRDTRQNVQGQ